MEDYYNKANSDLMGQGDGLSLNDIFQFLWRLKYWIIATVVVFLSIAYCYLKTQTTVYERTSWIKLNKSENSVNSQFSDLFGVDLSGNKALDDEVFILQSPSLMQKVVELLDLNTRYYHYTNPFFGNRILKDRLNVKLTEYYGDNPFVLKLTSEDTSTTFIQPSQFRLEFIHNGDSTFTVNKMFLNGNKKTLKNARVAYGQQMNLGGLTIRLSLNNADKLVAGDKYVATWTESFSAARGFLTNLSVTIQGSKANRTDIVLLTYRDSSPQRASDIINALTRVANQQARQYENLSSQEALYFINERLADIAGQLNLAEEKYKQYQSKRALVNNDTQNRLALESDRQYKDKLTEILLQLEVLDMVHTFMEETPPGTYRVIPSYIVVTDAGLSTMITKYNDKVVARDRMVFNSSEKNPKVQTINTELNASRRGIELSLDNLIQVYTLRQRDLEKVLDKSRDQISDIPEQQMEMQSLSRKVEVIEPLYRMLQERREEIQIAMYAAEDTFRIIETAFGNNIPVAPSGKTIYLLAFVLGFGLCPGIWILRSFLRGKVETKLDVEKAVDAPVLGVLPKSGIKKYVLVPQAGVDPLTEAFRMFRSNVQSIPDAKVWQVTSSVLAEGKSFVASNLALSLAYVGKKVLLIGMDLRKPTLRRIFRSKCDREQSLVAYLLGRADHVKEVIVRSEKSANLDLLFTGYMVADPTALLSSPRTEEMIRELRDLYDYVIIDTTPYFPVTDATIVNRYVDATLFSVRCDYTPLVLLKEIDAAIHREINPVRNAYVVINDFNAKAPKYKYSFGEEYKGIPGYGYAGGKYGYGKEKNE